MLSKREMRLALEHLKSDKRLHTTADTRTRITMRYYFLQRLLEDELGTIRFQAQNAGLLYRDVVEEGDLERILCIAKEGGDIWADPGPKHLCPSCLGQGKVLPWHKGKGKMPLIATCSEGELADCSLCGGMGFLIDGDRVSRWGREEIRQERAQAFIEELYGCFPPEWDTDKPPWLIEALYHEAMIAAGNRGLLDEIPAFFFEFEKPKGYIPYYSDDTKDDIKKRLPKKRGKVKELSDKSLKMWVDWAFSYIAIGKSYKDIQENYPKSNSGKPYSIATVKSRIKHTARKLGMRVRRGKYSTVSPRKINPRIPLIISEGACKTCGLALQEILISGKRKWKCINSECEKAHQLQA